MTNETPQNVIRIVIEVPVADSYHKGNENATCKALIEAGTQASQRLTEAIEAALSLIPETP